MRMVEQKPSAPLVRYPAQGVLPYPSLASIVWAPLAGFGYGSKEKAQVTYHLLVDEQAVQPLCAVVVLALVVRRLS